jgi:hypothetical protein
METVLLALVLLACPLGMLAIGAVGWVWAKARDKRTEEQATPRAITEES